MATTDYSHPVASRESILTVRTKCNQFLSSLNSIIKANYDLLRDSGFVYPLNELSLGMRLWFVESCPKEDRTLYVTNTFLDNIVENFDLLIGTLEDMEEVMLVAKSTEPSAAEPPAAKPPAAEPFKTWPFLTEPNLTVPTTAEQAIAELLVGWKADLNEIVQDLQLGTKTITELHEVFSDPIELRPGFNLSRKAHGSSEKQDPDLARGSAGNAASK